jgi:membrane-anchored protein YejM (alkaline phosphatase superfamily)
MKNIKQSCIEFFSDSETKKELFELFKPVTDSLYNELYIYLWIICFYSVVLFLLVLVNLFLLLKLLNKKELFLI